MPTGLQAESVNWVIGQFVFYHIKKKKLDLKNKKFSIKIKQPKKILITIKEPKTIKTKCHEPRQVISLLMYNFSCCI